MTQQYSSALDIIYSLPEQITQIMAKLAALETRNAMLEMKLDILSKKEPVVLSKAEEETDAKHHIDNAESDASEVMEIRSISAAKQDSPAIKQVNNEDAARQVAEVSQPLSIKDDTISNGIRIPSRDIDPMPRNSIPAEPVYEKQTATLIRGRLKDRDGSSIAAVDVKIFDEKSVMVKKTKTAATGEWIAMLPPGEYTVEFTKPGQKPLFKPISVVSGKKELEVLI